MAGSFWGADEDLLANANEQERSSDAAAGSGSGRPDAGGWAVGKVPDATKDVVETPGLDTSTLLDWILATRREASE